MSVLRESLTANVHELLMRRVRQLNEQLSAAIQHSALELHQLFRRTYGLTYDQNAQLFAQLFKDLQSNYNSNSVEQSVTPDVIVYQFFDRLFVRIFRVMNSQHSFPIEYDDCLAEQVKSLQPFGKHPDNLARSLKQSLGAYQTFVHGLKSGKFVLSELIKEVEASTACSNNLMRANDCALCSGHVGVRTCFGFCVHVLQQCLTEYTYLEQDWNAYIQAMRKLASKLDRSLSVPNAIDPIAIRISEAIMHFQENSIDITKEVFHNCGQLSSSVAKREVSSQSANLLRFKRQSSDLISSYSNRPINYSSDKWKQMIIEIKQELFSLKNYWSRLPRNLCSDDQLVNSRKAWQTDLSLSKQCWNGSDLIDV